MSVSAMTPNLLRILAPAALALGAAPSAAGNAVSVVETVTEYRIGNGTLTARITRNPWRLALEKNGRPCLSEANPALPDPPANPDHDLHDNRYNGIDSAYPGLTDVSYRPLAYRTTAWQHVTAPASVRATGHKARIAARTSDGRGAEVELDFGKDGALKLAFRPAAAGVVAIGESFDAPPRQPYFGGGQRFHGLNQRGKTLPLWISHGVGADRYYSTNEIAASFFWSPAGWGAWAAGDARGEINFALPYERPDAVNVLVEDDRLEIVLYCGTPQDIVATHTARAGRPAWTPPDWAWEPMVWQDSDTTADSVRALVSGMKERGIPLGAVWLDNPWDAGKASFDFDRNRFADPDALIQEVHAQGVRFMVWLSPFVTGPLTQFARDRNWLVAGTRPDNLDATYYDVTGAPEFGRGLDPHLDFTHPDAVAWWKEGLQGLIARGVDGVKVDRGEEDLSDDSTWFNGLPNRLNHNAYVGRYHQAIFESFQAQRPDGDFVILARGGWNGSARWAGHWAADNLSGPGVLGLGQALNSLLTLSASGFPFNSADIGGYAGTRQDAGAAAYGDPTQVPTENAYIRWTQLGALSPVMQTPIAPWWVGDKAIASYRRYATLHHRLVPYIAAAARAAVERGVPIVRPLPYAFPADPVAVTVEDQYLFGPDLLVAPIANADAELPVAARTVYLPAGTWTDFWSGLTYTGPLALAVSSPVEQLPLFVRSGAVLPPGVRADQLP